MYTHTTGSGSGLLGFSWMGGKNSDQGLSVDSPQTDRNCLIFWLLFLAAIDDDLYNNELSAIIDLAYCLKFDEPIIRDWCRAVQYVLEGNHLAEDCDLTCETAAGKQFFLHEKEE